MSDSFRRVGDHQGSDDGDEGEQLPASRFTGRDQRS
jgi:hypothetical protein